MIENCTNIGFGFINEDGNPRPSSSLTEEERMVEDFNRPSFSSAASVAAGSQGAEVSHRQDPSSDTNIIRLIASNRNWHHIPSEESRQKLVLVTNLPLYEGDAPDLAVDDNEESRMDEGTLETVLQFVGLPQ